MTENLPSAPERLQQLQEAADWVVRLSDPLRAESDVNEWLRWCDARPGNVEMFERVQQDWHDAAALKPTLKRSSLPTKAAPLRSRMLAGASLALACLAASVGLWLWHSARPETYQSGAMTRAATLPDGSSVTLSARTAVRVNLAPTQRRLAMSQGEAYFKVHHDPARRFVVDAGELRITAVGTAFDVRCDADLTTVTVEEGVVEIAPGPASPGASTGVWRVGAGYQLVYASKTRSASLTNVDPSRALQWRSGQLDYVGTSLNRVLDDVNRYSDRRILLGDPALGQLPYSGTVFVQSVDDWLQALMVVYPVQVRRADDGSLVLERTAR